MEHKIELLTGYTDKKGVEHREVTFGRRLTVGDVVLLDSDRRAQIPTQYNLLILVRMMTKLGELRMPPDIRVMLELDSVDRTDLSDGADAFLALGREGRTQEIREDGAVKICFGFEIDGTVYDVVHFGRLNTGADEVAADGLKLNGVAREAFLIGRRITRIETEDGVTGIDGAVDLDQFDGFDATDFNLLRIGAQMAEETFRYERAALRRKRDGVGSADPDEGNGDERVGDPESPDDATVDVSEGTKGAAQE